MFDTGSDRSYISENLVNKIGPRWLCSQEVACATFGKSTPDKIKLRNVFSLQLEGVDRAMSITCTETPNICATLSRPSIPKHILENFKGTLNVIQHEEGEISVDMLIGLDWYWHMMFGEYQNLTQGLVAQKTIFGWMVSGALDHENSKSLGVSHQLLCLDAKNEKCDHFWNLETIGITRADEEHGDNTVIDSFEKNIDYCDGRYVVGLPWKNAESKQKLMDNYNLAKARLHRLEAKLDKNESLKSRYSEAIESMENMNIIEEVPSAELSSKGDNPIYYMPHRPVVKEASLTTKVRPVFDASAKGYNGISLNDCLDSGPNLIPDLPGVLMRFCRWQYAITADISKAFLMIGVKKEDQDVHRFLWNVNGVTKTMRFTRVPFGNTSSMFLLMATLRHHLDQYCNSHTAVEMKQNMYVDNWLSGSDDLETACKMVRESKLIMEEAGMNLTQWGSNSQAIGNFVNFEFDEKCIEDNSLKVLGMKWVASEDVLVYECMQPPMNDILLTKRVMLGCISRFYDPLGFALPFTIAGRIITFQALWKLNIDWNEKVPENINVKFQNWIQDLSTLSRWKIPRRFANFNWHEMQSIEIHAFGDASPYAYGACVYIRMLSPCGEYVVKLTFARTRLAPVKQLTLPRLELLGALLCARLARLVFKELKLSEQVAVYCWSDSTVALSWIKNDSNRLKTFVQNRVSEIQSLVPPDNWRFCPGSVNPSDSLTRGVTAGSLMNNDNWLNGPSFLRDKSSELLVNTNCNSNLSERTKAEISKEEKRNSPVLTSFEFKQVFPIGRWSCWLKSIRIVAYVLRFINKMRKKAPESVELSYLELSEAKTVLLRDCQRQSYTEEYMSLSEGNSLSKRSSIYKLNPQMGADGLLRVCSRLQQSQLSTEEMYPIIVPKGHIALLISRHTHLINKHAGVNSLLVLLRDYYWIVSARSICKKVKSQCVTCRRHDSKPTHETMAPLPEVRIRPAPPFAVTGLDHGGVLYCCDKPGVKLYILLFTCAVTRAIHLELVESLSGETTIFAIRKFMARRGVPSIFMSDNAKCYKFASEKISSSFGPDGPRWRFIPPLSPWWGGFWERLIGLVKSALKKSIGRNRLRYIELETMILEVETVLNSRPLTYVGDSLDDHNVLTPAHFLIGRKIMSKPNIEADCSNSNDANTHKIVCPDLIARWEYQFEATEKFWAFWSSNYIRNLPPFRGPCANKPIQVGEVVLIKDENLPRLKWPLGRVNGVFHGVDGRSRVVQLKTLKGTITRPIQKLHKLEVGITETLPPIINDESDQLPFQL